MSSTQNVGIPIKSDLGQARKLNIIFNLKKCHYRENEVIFLGMIFSVHRMKSDPGKLKSIIELKISQNIKEFIFGND